MEDSKLIIEKNSKEELQRVFGDFLIESEFKILSTNDFDGVSIVKITDGVRKFELHYIIKNISSGGWKEEKSIRRIQIGNIKDTLVYTNKIRTHMLCGIIRYDNDYILVVWNSYLYTNHKTNRSCYISVDALTKSYKRGYNLVHEFNQDIWICDKKHFGLLIRDYINYNYVE